MPADGTGVPPANAASAGDAPALATEDGRVGVLLVGHGATASTLLAAARAIVPLGLEDIDAVDAGLGQTPQLEALLCDCAGRADHGRGVLVLVDLLGSSPCACTMRSCGAHSFALVSGLSLAMLLKLATLDRDEASLGELAEACAESAQRAIVVHAKEDRT